MSNLSDHVDEPGEIIPNKLYLGSIIAACNPERFTTLKLTAVVNCDPGTKNYFEDKCTYLNIDIQDDCRVDIRKHFESCDEFINSHDKTLVHCLGGASRSVTLTIAHLMKYNKMSLKESFEFVKQKRCIIRPNIGFFKQLLEYENHLYGKQTMEWEDYISDYYYLDLEIEKTKLYTFVKEITAKQQDAHLVNQEILNFSLKK